MSGNPWEKLYGDVDGDAKDVETVVEEQEKEAALTKTQRKQRARDARRSKVTLDFSHHPELEDLVRELAEIEKTGVSSAALWLLAEGLHVYLEGKRPRKEISRSLKYSYDLQPHLEGLDDL
jgi:hypothetical protein